MARILIVDDHPSIVTLLQRELASGRHTVLTAASGEEGLRKVREEEPDLLILDVMLPGMTGLEVLRRIKADPATCETVVILLSALDEPGEMTYGLQLGADWYLTKPFAPGDVETVVRRFLQACRWSAPAPCSERAGASIGEAVRLPLTAC